MLRTRAFLFPGLCLEWQCAKSVLSAAEAKRIPEKATLRFTGGLSDLIEEQRGKRALLGDGVFSGSVEISAESENKNGNNTGNGSSPTGRVEWAIAWLDDFKRRWRNLGFL